MSPSLSSGIALVCARPTINAIAITHTITQTLRAILPIRTLLSRLALSSHDAQAADRRSAFLMRGVLRMSSYFCMMDSRHHEPKQSATERWVPRLGGALAVLLVAAPNAAYAGVRFAEVVRLAGDTLAAFDG